MRTLALIALVTAACGGKKTPPPPANTTAPIAQTPPEKQPAELDVAGACDHMMNLMRDAGEDPGPFEQQCVIEVRKELGKWPAEVASESVRCLKEQKSVTGANDCNPEKIAAKRGIETPQTVKKEKTTEARQFVKKLYDGARAYYMDSQGGGQMNPLPRQFPVSAAITPPLGMCCKDGGKCSPMASYWTDATWVALQFSVDDPHYYSYSYTSDDVTKSFTASAYGDLDCDGVYSTFQMYGEITPDNPDGPKGSGSLYRENELE